MNRKLLDRLAYAVFGAAISGAAFQIHSSLSEEGLLPPGKPPYLNQLAAQGMSIQAIDDDLMAGTSLRAWELDRGGVSMYAYAPLEGKSLVVGGQAFDEQGRPLEKTVETYHQRTSLTADMIASETAWVPLSQESPDTDETITYWLMDPSTRQAASHYQSFVSNGGDARQIRVIPYPLQNNRSSTPSVLAILEADYRTPENQSPIVTQRRGGDLGFTHSPHDVLIDLLESNSKRSPQAPSGHPAEEQAYNSLSSNIYFQSRLGFTEAMAIDVFPNKKDAPEKGKNPTFRPLFNKEPL